MHAFESSISTRELAIRLCFSNLTSSSSSFRHGCVTLIVESSDRNEARVLGDVGRVWTTTASLPMCNSLLTSAELRPSWVSMSAVHIDRHLLATFLTLPARRVFVPGQQATAADSLAGVHHDLHVRSWVVRPPAQLAEYYVLRSIHAVMVAGGRGRLASTPHHTQVLRVAFHMALPIRRVHYIAYRQYHFRRWPDCIVSHAHLQPFHATTSLPDDLPTARYGKPFSHQFTCTDRPLACSVCCSATCVVRRC